MKTYTDKIDPPRNPMPLRTRLLMALSGLFLTLLFLMAVLAQPWIEPKWMFLDTLAAAELAPGDKKAYFGFVSNVGILLWTATTTASLFTATLLWAIPSQRPLFRMALTAGLLTGWVALDDLFLLHEKVFPDLGLTQTMVLAVYAVLGLLYGVMNWRFLLRQDWWLLALAGVGLATSMAVDVLLHSLSPAAIYLEDGAKFVGICCWTLFHLLVYAGHLKPRVK